MSANRRTFLLLAACLLTLSACSTGPKYQRPVLSTPPPAFKEPLPAGWKEATPRDEVAKGDWWRIFNDSVLDELEEQATRANQSVKAAAARVEQARALAKLSHADLFPALRSDLLPATGRAAGNRPVQPNSSTRSYHFESFSVPVDMSYEIDLWGGLRNSERAAQITVEANAAQYETALLTLKADVARTYFMLRGIDTDRAVLKRNIQVQKQALELAKRRHDGGLASGLDVSQAETLLASTNAEWIAIGRLRQQIEHFLAVLVARPAPTFTVAEKFQDRVPPRIPEGLPSDLLERRPDIAAAERQIAASFAKMGVARATYFPSFTFTGNAGLLSKSLSTLLAANSGSLLLNPLFSIPIFQGGRPAARYEYAKKVYEESVANYRVRIAIAYQEVEDGLSDLRVLQEQGQAVEQVLQAARRTLQISTARYEQGLANHLEVLDAERTVLANERLAAQTLGFRMLASVQLIKALGGGWEDRQHP